MARGGKRKGTGRPAGSGERREPTKTVRVPLSFAEKIPELLKKHQEENSFEDLQLPAKAHEDCLPLERLAWEAFEVFCFDLVAQILKPSEIYRYGTQGDNQQGIDIVADIHNGEKWAFQCKQWQRFNKSDAIKVIQQAKEFKANRYILLLSRVASVEVRKVIDNAPRWEVWDVHNISQKVRKLPPEIARRLVRTHFHPAWQNAFLGISKLNPFVSSEDFFQNWLDSNQPFNHTWKLEGRDGELKSLHEFVTSSEKQVAILPGRGGIGKTKLLYEFAKTFDYPQFHLWFVEKGKLVTPENANELPLYSCVIVLDDAHKPEHEQDLKTVLALMRERYRNKLAEIKLVLSSRPHAVKHLNLVLREGGISSSQILIWGELKNLKLSDAKFLARQALGSDYAHFAELLATVSQDCPLVTVVGGHFLSKNKIPWYLLERDDNFQDEVLDKFEDDLVKEVSNDIDPKTCKNLLNLIAAVSPIQLNEPFQQTAPIFLSIKKSEFIAQIGILEQSGILLRQGNGLSITPDVLSDYILHNACVTPQGYLTGYAEEVYAHFKQVCLKEILSNLAELDWRIQSSSGEKINLLDHIWTEIRYDFQSSSHYGRCQILGFLEEACYNQPEYTLELIKFAINYPATLSESQYTPFDTHEAVLRKVPALLHKISYTMDYLSECCDILWKLGTDRKDDYHSEPNHPIQILIDLAQYDLYKPDGFQKILLDSIQRWLKQNIMPEHINLLLNIIDPVLQKDFEANYLENWTVYFRKIRVSRKKTQHLRDQALNLINSCLKSDQIRVVLRALKSLAKALEEQIGQLAPLTPEQFSQEWGSEQLKIIEIMAQFVIQNTHALLHLEVIDILRWYAHHSCTVAIKDKAREVINSIPDTYELRLNKVLCHKYDWDWDEDTENPHQKYKQLVEEMPQQVANEFLQRYPEAIEGVQILNQKLQEIQDTGFQSTPYYFMEAIANANVSYATSMCQLLIQQSDLLLTSHLTPLLSKIRLDHPDSAIELIKDALNINNPNLLAAVARIYLAQDWAKEYRDEDVMFIKKLLNYPNLNIRSVAIKSLGRLGYYNPHLGVSLALSVNLGSSKELASELCQLFTFEPGINPNLLTDKHLEEFLSKFLVIKSIDDHWIERFLMYASKKVPDELLEFLLTRIEQNIQTSEIDYQPLPYGELKYTFQLDDNNKSKEIIRTMREMSLQKTHTVRFWLPKLFRSVLSSATVLSLSILDEWIDSEEIEKVEAVSLLLSVIPQSFILTRIEFLTKLLEQAYNLGDECYETTTENLFNALIIACREGTVGQPYREDVTLRDQSFAIASQLLIGSPAHKFYSSLVKYAEANITREIALDATQMD